jgi:hypothetical protein
MKIGMTLLEHHCHALTRYIDAMDRSIAVTTGPGVPK